MDNHKDPMLFEQDGTAKRYGSPGGRQPRPVEPVLGGFIDSSLLQPKATYPKMLAQLLAFQSFQNGQHDMS